MLLGRQWPSDDVGDVMVKSWLVSFHLLTELLGRERNVQHRTGKAPVHPTASRAELCSPDDATGDQRATEAWLNRADVRTDN